MSIKQMISLCLTGNIDSSGLVESPAYESLRTRCEMALDNLNSVIEESHNIQTGTVTASQLMTASSKQVHECLTCPSREKAEDADKERENLP